jgi:hypothetical protein
MSSGFLRCAARWLAATGRRRLEDAHLQRLVAATALGDAELDPGARLE